MRPQKSNLLLESYFTTELNCKANFNYDVSKGHRLDINQLTIESNILSGKRKSDGWQVTLTVFHQPTETSNSPYSFRIVLVGFFKVDKNYPKAMAEWLVKTNASSVLYSIARESLRKTMQDGPWAPCLLPTVSFYTNETKAELKAIKKA